MAKIDHIGVAVRSVERAARLYEQGLGLELAHIETLSEQGVRVGFLPVGETDIELLEPLSAESIIGRFLEQHGEGLHHICVEVPDILAAMACIRELGLRLVSEEPLMGAGGKLVVFVHPRGANGVLLELSQKPSP
jgi:methylmalonyl-CoA epimerase